MRGVVVVTVTHASLSKKALCTSGFVYSPQLKQDDVLSASAAGSRILDTKL
jgi:hypothetical protein